MEQPQQPEISPLLIGGPPWEKKHELGFFVAFIETVKGFLFHPANTFSVMRRTAGIGDALVYSVALQVFAFLWTIAVTGVDPAALLPQSPELQSMFQFPENISQILVILYPFTVVLMLFISALSVHLALKWRSLQNYDFALIFRILAYANGSAALLMIIPVLGGLLSFMMLIYLVYTGLRTIYGLGTSSFAITTLLALGISLGCYLVLTVVLTLLIFILPF